MRRWVTVLALTVAMSFALVGCGKSNSTNTATGGSTAAAATTSSTCPTTEQGGFRKTRFAADIGLIIGTSKHFIITPYTQGAFNKGVSHRILHFVKAAAAAAAVIHLIHAAVENAKSDPLLCKTLVQPLTDVENTLGSIKDKIMGGDTSAITNLGGTLGGLESTAKGQGLSFVSGIIPGL